MTGLLAFGQTLARANDSSENAESVQPASYRTARKINTKLHWLPYQPERAAGESVRPVQYTAPTSGTWSQTNAPTPAKRVSQEELSPPNALNEPTLDRNTSAPAAPLGSIGAPAPSSDTPSTSQGGSTDRVPNVLSEPREQSAPSAGAGGVPDWKPTNKGLAPIPKDGSGFDSKFGFGPNQPSVLKDITCPKVKDLKPITKIDINIAAVKGEVPRDCPWGDEESFKGRSWEPITFSWTASALCHKPLYLEDEKLERYGHMCGPWLQPVISHARFFATVPILPYKMGLELPNECIYTLGHYRPGSCAPYYLDPIPLSVRAALFQAGAVVGGIAIIP